MTRHCLFKEQIKERIASVQDEKGQKTFVRARETLDTKTQKKVYVRNVDVNSPEQKRIWYLVENTKI